MDANQQLATNATEIANLKSGYKEIWLAIDEMRNTLLNRPTQTMLKVVGIMSGALGAAIGVATTLLIILIKAI